MPDGVLALAASALDRIVDGNSEWRELWEKSGDGAPTLAALQEIRTTLDAALNKR